MLNDYDSYANLSRKELIKKKRGSFILLDPQSIFTRTFEKDFDNVPFKLNQFYFRNIL